MRCPSWTRVEPVDADERGRDYEQPLVDPQLPQT